MDEKQFQMLIKELKGIHTTLAAMGRAMKSDAPNYQRPLAAYKTFDWASIGAIILENDGDGPSRVEYMGHQFTRRSGAGKFGQGIWFSRPLGKNEDGSNKYARLITFKDYSEAEELDERIQVPAEPAKPQSRVVGRPPVPTKPNGPIPDKDWEADALTCDDPLIFDSAVANAILWFGSTERVEVVRRRLFGEWEKGRVPAYMIGLKEYARKRDELEQAGKTAEDAHKAARSAALLKYEEVIQ